MNTIIRGRWGQKENVSRESRRPLYHLEGPAVYRAGSRGSTNVLANPAPNAFTLEPYNRQQVCNTMASDIEASMAALRQLKEQSNAKLKE